MALGKASDMEVVRVRYYSWMDKADSWFNAHEVEYFIGIMLIFGLIVITMFLFARRNK